METHCQFFTLFFWKCLFVKIQNESRLVMGALHLQVCIPEVRTLLQTTQREWFRGILNLLYRRGFLLQGNLPSWQVFWLHKHRYLCCTDKEQTLGQSGFATTQKGKRAQSMKTAGLGKFSPRSHTMEWKTAACYTEGKGKRASPFLLILLSHIKENILA